MAHYPVLQSGFVSSDVEHLKLPKEYDKFYVDNILAKNHLHDANGLFYSDKVSELFKDWSADHTLSKDFEFREKVLTLAKVMFKNKSFYKWLDFQTEHAELTEMHKLFIYDTMNYIASNNPEESRRLEPVQWISLIKRNLEEVTVEVKISHFFNKEDRSALFHLPGKLTELLTLWISKPRGIDDLLTFLYVVFGDRPYITDVADNPVT